MLPLAQSDFLDILSKLLSLGDKDPSVLLALFLVLAGIYLVIDRLARIPGAFTSWRKRRKGEAPIDPTTKLLNDLAEAVTLLTRNQTQNADNTKRLIDRADLLEGVVQDNTLARREYTEALKAQNQLLTTQATTLQTLLTDFHQAIGDMRGAQTVLVDKVNAHTDEIQAGISSTIRSVSATAEGNAAKLTSLTQKADEHSAMTEQKLQALMEQVERIPDLLKAEIRDAFTDMQTQLKAKDAEIARLQAALNAVQHPVAPADDAPVTAPEPAAKDGV